MFNIMFICLYFYILTYYNEGTQNQQESENHTLTVNDIIIVDPDTLELDLNHGRIGKLQNLEPLRQVERLYLRWNLITKIENLDTLTTLKELELYDNQISKIEGLDALVNLEYVKNVINTFIRCINILGYWIYHLIEYATLKDYTILLIWISFFYHLIR